MKRVLVALIAGTVLSGLAAAYATTRSIADERTPMKAALAESIAKDGLADAH